MTANREFAEKGYKNVKTEELAKEIGISKRTLYENFPSKENLFEVVVEDGLMKIEKKVNDIILKLEENKETDFFNALMSLWQVDSESTMNVTKQFFADVKKYVPKIWIKIAEFRQTNFKTNFYKLAEFGIEQGYIRDDIDLDLLYLVHSTLIQNILVPDVIVDLPYKPDDVIKNLYNILMFGTTTEKARNKYKCSC